MKKDLSGLEKFGYYILCFCTLGWAWYLKIIIKKAIVEATN